MIQFGEPDPGQSLCGGETACLAKTVFRESRMFHVEHSQASDSGLLSVVVRARL
jgi:hypothetical protein